MGQFGIGFNVVYYIIDVLLFLIKGIKILNDGFFIMFDLYCKYVLNVILEDFGLRVDDFKLIEENYFGVYNIYLQKEFLVNLGIWFWFFL